ncbi:MAG: hypothetical protein EA411_09660 [Saprospirales bacterium]|nr:MAG: hypothetical protein EA411_09660 [Saprospirales bacterium]
MASLLTSCEKSELKSPDSFNAEDITAEVRSDTDPDRPIGANFLKWDGNLDEDCYPGQPVNCLEIIGQSAQFDGLLDAIEHNSVANYLTSTEGQEKFPFPDNYVNGLVNGTKDYYYFSPSSSPSTYFAIK